jgi:hypothetical protein
VIVLQQENSELIIIGFRDKSLFTQCTELTAANLRSEYPVKEPDRLVYQFQASLPGIVLVSCTNLTAALDLLVLIIGIRQKAAKPSVKW